jgi:hypothetical protein
MNVPLSASERQSDWALGTRTRTSGLLRKHAINFPDEPFRPLNRSGPTLTGIAIEGGKIRPPGPECLAMKLGWWRDGVGRGRGNRCPGVGAGVCWC